MFSHDIVILVTQFSIKCSFIVPLNSLLLNKVKCVTHFRNKKSHFKFSKKRKKKKKSHLNFKVPHTDLYGC